MVSISPVPKLDPAPVSYIQLPELGAVPAEPLKSSLNWVVQPDGGDGTVLALTSARLTAGLAVCCTACAAVAGVTVAAAGPERAATAGAAAAVPAFV